MNKNGYGHRKPTAQGCKCVHPSIFTTLWLYFPSACKHNNLSENNDIYPFSTFFEDFSEKLKVFCRCESSMKKVIYHNLSPYIKINWF